MFILSNMPRSKGNKKIKFGQLIKYNMKNINPQISCTKCVREDSPRSFYKKPISRSMSTKIY